MTRARNIAGFSTITTTPSPIHVGPIGVLTATRIDGEFGVVDIQARTIEAVSIAATNFQVSGITTGLNVSGIITAQNGINFNGTSTGLNVSGVSTIATLSVTGNANIAGVLTYEDVTNVDSVGVITARSGIQLDDSITHIGDTNTKIRFPDNDQISFETGGVERMIIGVGGDIAIEDTIKHSGDTNTKIRFPAADTISFETGGSERVRVTSGGRLLVGTDTGRQTRSGNSSFQPDIQLESDVAGFSVGKFNDSDGPARLVLQKARGSKSSPTIVQDNDEIGSLTFSGWDGDTFTNTAHIRSEVDGTPGDDDMPGNLIFYTTGDGSSVSSERLRIDSTGLVKITKSGSGANAKLEIAQPSGGGGTSEIVFSDAVTGRGRVFYDHGSNPEGVKLEAAGTLGLIATTSGKIGIGTDNPDRILHIQNAEPIIKLTDSDGNLSAEISGNSGNLIFDSHNNNRDFIFRGGNTEVVRITGDGGVGIGTADPGNDKVKVQLSDSNNSNFRVVGGSGQGRTNISVQASNAASGSITAYRLVNSVGTAVGSFHFDNSTDDINLMCTQQGGNIYFHTNESGSSLRKMEIHDDGHVKINNGDLIIGTGGHGIDFSADDNASGSTSELLNDYEEGEFTPSATDSNNTFSQGQESGRYIKVGNIVQCTFTFNCSISGTSGYAFFIQGLPFTVKNYGSHANEGIGICKGTGQAIQLEAQQDQTKAKARNPASGSAMTVNDVGCVNNVTKAIRGTITYHTT